MTADRAVEALALPEAAGIGRRVPKKLLVEHGAPTPADKRRIEAGIEQIVWVATLKPSTVAVAAYRDGVRQYLEVAVLRMTLRAGAKVSRLLELLHRAVPHPVLALTEHEGGLTLSVAAKRWSLGEADKTVLDGPGLAVEAPTPEEPYRGSFWDAMALARQPRASLLALYEGWADTLRALEAARRTGKFEVLDQTERRAGRAEALATCERLETEIQRLTNAAKKEKQTVKQVALNLEVQERRREYEAWRQRL